MADSILANTGGNMLQLDATQAQIEGGAFSDVEVHVAEGIVVKAERELMTYEVAMQRQQDLIEYASRFNGTPIQIAPLRGVRVDQEGTGFRVRHAAEYIQGHSIRSLSNESAAARRAMAHEVAMAVSRMPSMRGNDDRMLVGLDLVERNLQVAGIQSRMPGRLILVDMTPPILRRPDGSINVSGDPYAVYFYDRYFATKSGAIARYLVDAFWPVPVKEGSLEFDVERFAAGLADVIPKPMYRAVVDAMGSFATERCDSIGAIILADEMRRR